MSTSISTRKLMAGNRRIVTAIAAATALSFVAFAPSPAPAAEQAYEKSCDFGGPQPPEPFTLHGEVESGPVEPGGEISITGLRYEEAQTTHDGVRIEIGGEIFDLGEWDGYVDSIASTAPIDVTIPAPDEPGTFEVAPTVIYQFYDSGFEVACNVIEGGAPLGIVEIEAPADDPPADDPPADDPPVDDSPADDPPSEESPKGASPSGNGATPIQARPAYTG